MFVKILLPLNIDKCKMVSY